jgi:hypothetical protein
MTAADEYDSPWKEAIEGAFPEFMEFFFPGIAACIDWGRGHEFLEQELRQIVRDADTGRRHVDKLVKVYRRDGAEDFVYIHLEIQGGNESAFGRRMFTYNYRLFDRYGRPIASLALLADDSPHWRPTEYSHEIFGCRQRFEFPAVKLLDFRVEMDELLEHPNPFAWIVAAHRQTRSTRGDAERRYQAKLALARLLYRKGWDRRRILDWFAILDWMMRLPKELDQRLWQEINSIEEEQRMRYVTSFERFHQEEWMEKGVEKGMEEGQALGRRQGESNLLRKQLRFRFGALPPNIERRIETADETELEQWGEALLTAPSLDAIFGQ